MQRMVGHLVMWLGLLGILTVPLSADAEPRVPHNSFDNDNYADLAVGVPGDAVAVSGAANAADVRAGAVNILPGSSIGVLPDLEPRLSQALAMVSGDAEPGDGFGIVLAAGDFNGDGFIDLAVGVPLEDVPYQGNNIENAGAVNIVHGTADGLVPANEPIWHQDVDGIPGSPESWDKFGGALAAGDFDGDGRDDLAIGVPAESLGSSEEGMICGAVHVLYSSTGDLTATGNQLWTQQDLGLGYDANCSWYQFGISLASGDFDGDGYTDLAIGANGEDVSGKDRAGAVNILFGSGSGLTATGSMRLHQDEPGVDDRCEGEDFFGTALAAGDFDSDGYADLAVGVPYEDIIEGADDAGAVNILYGSATGPRGYYLPIWYQGSVDVLGSPEGDDRFGRPLAAGDINGDGYVDLAIGVPYEDVGSVLNAGAVNVLYGSAEGLTATGNQLWHQDTPGVPDGAAEWNWYGEALAIGDSNSDTYADLAVGIPFYNIGTADNAGAVNLLYGSAQGLTAGSDPLWAQNHYTIDGAFQEGDEFGYALVFGQRSRNLVARPTWVIASDGTYDTEIRVAWDDVGADYYGVYYATALDGVKYLAGVATSNVYSHTDAGPGIALWYFVRAYIGGDWSAFSDADSGWRRFYETHYLYLPIIRSREP
jgi:hypothetical protein